MTTILQHLGRLTGQSVTQNGLPVYESLRGNPPRKSLSVELPAEPLHDLTNCHTASSSSSSTLFVEDPDPAIFPVTYHPSLTGSYLGNMLPTMPSLRTFLSNFTLGFADGLTVPFALTAGLSSLGQTRTVIYAGMAEICAGSISMGIGGYLAARSERQVQSAPATDSAGEDSTMESEERLLKGGDAEKTRAGYDHVDEMGRIPEVLARYLAPLRLSVGLEEEVLAHIKLHGYDGCVISGFLEHSHDEEPRGCSPVMEGLSVSLGYLVGGVLPLFPYFFVAQVNSGLLWSFVVCVIALFVFGFGKDYLLNKDSGNKATGKGPWQRVKSSLWEGVQMVVLGSIAALAAVLCVRLLDGTNPDAHTPA